jgi:hypothetical protein
MIASSMMRRRPMSIPVVCRCGRKLVAKDAAAGRIVPCPECGRPIEIPSLFFARDDPIPIAVECSDPPSPARGESRHLIWKDPVVLIGAAVPSVILLVFFAYLVNRQAERKFRERIALLRAEADRFVADGNMMAAREKYQAIISYAGEGNPGDDPTRAHIEAASLDSHGGKTG